MKYISSREFRIHPGTIWQFLAQGEDVVVTAHGKPLGILMSTAENNVQQLLNELVRLRARLAVSAMQEKAKKKGLDQLSMDEVDEIIAKVRKTNSL